VHPRPRIAIRLDAMPRDQRAQQRFLNQIIGADRTRQPPSRTPQLMLA